MVSQNTFKNLLNYLVVFIIFSDALVLNTTYLFEVRLSYFIMILFLSVFLAYTEKIYFSKAFLALFIIIVCCSLVNVYLGNDSTVLILKQVSGILINASVFYLLIKFNKEDVKKLFQIYLNLAFIVGLIGIIQEAGYILHIRLLFDYRWILPKMLLPEALYTEPLLRINSIMPEPSSFCIAMAPALFAALISLLKNNFELISRKKTIVIILAFFLSFSIAGYIAFFCVILLLILSDIKRNKKNIIYFVAITLAMVYFLKTNDSMKNKAADTFLLFTGKVKVENTNRTTRTLFNNIFVTRNVLKDSPIIGHGLGSHPKSYQRYLPQEELLNTRDANSLFLRILSETGIVGLLIFFGFIIKFYIPRKSNKLDYLWVINNSIIILFMVRLIRQGHYFSEGFFFFFWLYYFTKKLSDNTRLNENSH